MSSEVAGGLSLLPPPDAGEGGTRPAKEGQTKHYLHDPPYRFAAPGASFVIVRSLVVARRTG